MNHKGWTDLFLHSVFVTLYKFCVSIEPGQRDISRSDERDRNIVSAPGCLAARQEGPSNGNSKYDGNYFLIRIPMLTTYCCLLSIDNCYFDHHRSYQFIPAILTATFNHEKQSDTVEKIYRLFSGLFIVICRWSCHKCVFHQPWKPSLVRMRDCRLSEQNLWRFCYSHG